MTRLLCCGDLHLDKGGRYGRVPGERLAEQEAVWARALAIGAEHEVDAVLFAGDAFEKRHPSPEAMLAFERPLLDASAPVLAVAGNHDVAHLELGTGLDVFHTGGLLELARRPRIVELAGVAVACLPWAPVSRIVASQNGGDRDEINRHAADLLTETARGLRAQAEGPCVLLTHFSITGAVTPDGADVGMFREPVLDLSDLEAIGFDAVIAGHIHKPALLNPDTPYRGNPINYVGSPMPLDFGERKCEHGVWILDLNDEGATMTFEPLESRPFVTLDWEYELAETLLDLDPWKSCGRPFAEGAFVKLRYSCTVEEARHLDATALRQALLDMGAQNAWVEPTIERPLRARVDGLDESVDDTTAMVQWIELNVDGDGDRKGDVLDLHTEYLEELSR